MQIALGSAQFGMDYGISNQSGKVSLGEVESILDFAAKNGVNTLDTAALYGDSEKVLGYAQASKQFNIVTKTVVFPQQAKLTRQDADHVITRFTDSLKNLRASYCYGLLIHHIEDLLKEGGEYLMEALRKLKNDGLVHKIGVSVYHGSQIDALLSRFGSVDIVQLPLNCLDQRLIKGNYLKLLKQHDVEIHVRSIFLQGLLMLASDRIPSYFQPILMHLKKYHQRTAAENLSLLEAALLFIIQQQEVDYAVLGVTSQDELYQIICAVKKLINHRPVDFSFAAIDDDQYVNPVNWKVSYA